MDSQRLAIYAYLKSRESHTTKPSKKQRGKKQRVGNKRLPKEVKIKEVVKIHPLIIKQQQHTLTPQLTTIPNQQPINPQLAQINDIYGALMTQQYKELLIHSKYVPAVIPKPTEPVVPVKPVDLGPVKQDAFWNPDRHKPWKQEKYEKFIEKIGNAGTSIDEYNDGEPGDGPGGYDEMMKKYELNGMIRIQRIADWGLSKDEKHELKKYQKKNPTEKIGMKRGMKLLENIRPGGLGYIVEPLSFQERKQIREDAQKREDALKQGNPMPQPNPVPVPVP